MAIKYKRGKHPNTKKYGKDNPKWKGDGAGYVSKHCWMYLHFGKPTTCEKCGRSNLKGKYINWANISGEYKRKRKDWIRLCKKCHVVHDNAKILTLAKANPKFFNRWSGNWEWRESWL